MIYHCQKFNRGFNGTCRWNLFLRFIIRFVLDIIFGKNNVHNVLIRHGLCCTCFRFTGCKFIKLHITQPPLHPVPYIWCWGRRGSSCISDAGSTAWCLNPALRKQFWMMVEKVSLQNAAIMFVACTISRALRRELASLLFSTQARYLSASFFLYLLFADRMIPWSSGCIIEVALGGSMRNLMWE